MVVEELEVLFKSLVDLCGDKSKAEVLLEHAFPKEDRRARHLLHRCNAGKHLDWRWEQLEEVAGQIGELYPHRFRPRNWSNYSYTLSTHDPCQIIR